MPHPRITICLPHWQVKDLVSLCLRSLRRHAGEHDLEILVVDNGSRDHSLDYLRSLSWIRLIERPDESAGNWPANVFTAWDRGLREATGDYFVTMHTDVLLKQDGVFDRLIQELDRRPKIAAAGAWKLELQPAWYLWQKEVVGSALASVKSLLGRRARSAAGRRYPRDYFALYRRDALLRHGLTFCPRAGEITGGYSIARQLWDHGYETSLIPTHEMAGYLVHVAHGTAALAAVEKPLHHSAAQKKVERRVARLFQEPWIQALRADTALDAA